MSVCLTKPTGVREITPVHLFDEVCPVNAVSQHQGLADFLYITLIRVIEEDVHNLDIIPILFELSEEEDVSDENLKVRNNRVICTNVDNPLFGNETVYTSKLLDSLQSLLEYLEQPTANFDGFCNCLRTTWTAQENYYYLTLCQFLADIKHNEPRHIEDVLMEEESYCYAPMLCGNGSSDSEMDSFLSYVNTKLFSSLYDLLAPETSITVHPLFLFACKNFCADRHLEDDDWHWTRSRASLRAYGRNLEGVVLPKSKKIPEFFDEIDVCSDIVPAICVIEILISLSLSAATIYAGHILAWLYVSWFAISVGSLVSLKVLPNILNNRESLNQMIERHGGLHHYLQMNEQIKYALPTEMIQLEPKLVQKLFM